MNIVISKVAVSRNEYIENKTKKNYVAIFLNFQIQYKIILARRKKKPIKLAIGKVINSVGVKSFK